MGKIFIYLLAAFLVFIGGYLLIFELVVPKIATLTIPRKWNRIPLGQPKNTVHAFLSEPNSSLNLIDPFVDYWAGGSKDKMYFLQIKYNLDTIATGYSIHYQLTNGFVSKNYLIDSASVN